MYSHLTVGVLALQGDFEKHLDQLNKLGAGCREVRRIVELEGLNGLIFPGGESTTISQLIDRFSMRQALAEFCAHKAVWGTCAGMIMLATRVDDNRVNPFSIIDISIIRNGYGRQIYSFYTEIDANLDGQPIVLKASFIRAPLVLNCNPGVKVYAAYKDSPVLLSHKKCLVSSFHTELDCDLTLSKFFLDKFVSL